SGVSQAVSIENYVATSQEQADEAVKAAESAVDEDRIYLRKQFIRRSGEQVLTMATEAAADEEYPLPPEMLRQVKEAAFRLDVALNAKPMDEIERTYSLLRELATEVEGHVTMVKHRRGEGVFDVVQDLELD